MAYLYRHIRLDKNEPFYIGIGSDEKFKRANEKSRRNKIWNDIVSKTDYKIEILFENLTWEQACEKEKEFIALYGRINKKTGVLVNLTDGGEGTKGVIKSIELRKSISERQLGEKNHMYGKTHTDEVKRIISETHKGNKVNLGRIQSEETKRKKSESVKKAYENPDLIKKLSDIRIGGQNVRAKRVINTITNKIYDCIRHAFLDSKLTCSEMHFASMLSGRKTNKTNFKLINNK
jgi:mannose/fructose/N-acetylgalactosamine-specific phosphotransferase system component IIB